MLRYGLRVEPSWVQWSRFRHSDWSSSLSFHAAGDGDRPVRVKGLGPKPHSAGDELIAYHFWVGALAWLAVSWPRCLRQTGVPANRTCDASYLARHAWWDTEKEYINAIWDVSSVPLFSKCLILLNYRTPPLDRRFVGRPTRSPLLRSLLEEKQTWYERFAMSPNDPKMG